MKATYSIIEAKDILRYKNEETIRRYIRAGRSLNNDLSEIESVTTPGEVGYLSLCTLENVLPYQITRESFILLLTRKLNISRQEAEAILNNFDREKNDMGSNSYHNDSGESQGSDSASRLGNMMGDIAGATVETVAGIGLGPFGLLTGMLAGKVLSSVISNSVAVPYDEKPARERQSGENNKEYLKDIVQEIGLIKEQLKAHDDDINDTRRALEAMAQEKKSFDEIYNNNVEAGRLMLADREKSKREYMNRLEKLQEEMMEVVHNMD